MAYDLQEQESIDQLKAWWEKWGTPITAVVCAGCLAFAGWNGWQWWKRNEAAKAAGAYMALQQAAQANDVKNIASLSNGLLESYGSTVYAPLGALVASKAALAAGNLDEAAAKLKWIVDQSGRPEFDTIARVRLAGIYFDAGKLDDAIAVLDGAKPTERQNSLVLDRRGDVLAAKGDVKGARECWMKVLEAPYRGDPILKVVEYKLNALPAVQ